MNNTRYHRFRIERDAPTQEQYGSIVVGIPIGVDDFDKSSISTTEESIIKTISALLKTADIPVSEIAARFSVARSTLYRNVVNNAAR